MNAVMKFLGKTAVSLTKSIVMAEAKGKIKTFIDEKLAKTPEQINQEMLNTIGYVTANYTVKNNQKWIHLLNKIILPIK
jgi:hypothetical protein